MKTRPGKIIQQYTHTARYIRNMRRKTPARNPKRNFVRSNSKRLAPPFASDASAEIYLNEINKNENQ